MRRRNARHGRHFFRGGLAQAFEASEVLEESLAPLLADAGDRLEDRGQPRPTPALPVVGDREAVRLVAQPLEQEQPVGVPRQNDRIDPAGGISGLACAGDLMEPGQVMARIHHEDNLKIFPEKGNRIKIHPGGALDIDG